MTRRALPVALLALLLAFSAQQMLTPVLAPLARELDLAEVQLGLIITVSAAVVAVASPLWGRLVDRAGPRTALALGVAVAAAGLGGFAAVSVAGLGGDGGVGPGGYAALVLTRGLLFGAGLSALPVAALAIAALTSDAAGRTRAVSAVGAAQGLSLITGSALGGALALAGLAVPLWTAPVLLAGVLVLVLVALPRGRATTPRDRGEQPAADPGLAARDRRVWPYLVAAFTLLSSLALVQIVLGFLVQDRTGRSAEATAGAVGLALLVTGLVLVAVQGVLVRRLGWSPPRLLLTGIPVAVVGLVVLAVAAGLAAVVAGLVLLAVGLGLAIPGYTAGPTLPAADHEQGRVAGWVGAASGAGFVVAPTAGTALYGLGTWVPALVAAGAATVAWLLVATTVGRRSSSDRGEAAGRSVGEPDGDRGERLAADQP